jgi:hypothetical protein
MFLLRMVKWTNKIVTVRVTLKPQVVQMVSQIRIQMICLRMMILVMKLTLPVELMILKMKKLLWYAPDRYPSFFVAPTKMLIVIFVSFASTFYPDSYSEIAA